MVKKKEAVPNFSAIGQCPYFRYILSSFRLNFRDAHLKASDLITDSLVSTLDFDL